MFVHIISNSFLVTSFTLILLLFIQEGYAINCYTCSSYNGSNPACEDPIDTSLSKFTEKCMVPKKGHVGLFPANFCIKIVGKNANTYTRMVIRSCAMKTMDSQCGMFRYQDTPMTGCVLTCDYNGCNFANNLKCKVSFILITSLLIFSPIRLSSPIQ